MTEEKAREFMTLLEEMIDRKISDANYIDPGESWVGDITQIISLNEELTRILTDTDK